MKAISVQNLSKIYKLYDSNKDRLKEAINPLKKKYYRDFYALNNISFEVQKGETLGIIGKNGSGKSTLLKIITGLLTPTMGNIEVNGKVSALLELGAGFNPEYSGIENIYLNGTITGFTREEMNSKMEDIVSFADIGNFLYQPVKIYSSGMFVRLAFAVSINVEPDILIIDEALAVGDIRFQQKCYRKINDLHEKGKTILFCTHDTGAVLNLCSSCLWIHDGYIKNSGDPDEIIKNYQAYMYYDQNIKEVAQDNAVQLTQLDRKEVCWLNVENCSFFGEGGAEITDVCFYDEETGKSVSTLKGGEKVVLGIKATILSIIEAPIFGFSVKNSYSVNAFSVNTFQEKCKIKKFTGNEKTEVLFSFIFPPLSNGIYSIDLSVADGTQMAHVQHCWKYDALSIKVENIGDKYNFGYIYLDTSDIRINRSAN